MSLVKSFTSRSAALPSGQVRLFLLKLAGLLVLWQVCYTNLLKPLRVPDKLLTDMLTRGVAACINLCGGQVEWAHSNYEVFNCMMVQGKTVLSIYDDCNGLDLMAIYLGLMVLLPYPLGRKLAFGAGGVAVLLVANVVRCVLLYLIYTHWQSAFAFNHHYTFTILMYLLIFQGWLLFTRSGRLQ